MPTSSAESRAPNRRWVSLLSLCAVAAMGPAQDRVARRGVAQHRVVEKDAAAPPNIVFIMADELGYFELSCMGHPHIQTPNIDKMARGGMRFTQCLAGAPLCAPTRCTLLTGKHSGHTSVRTNGGGTPLRAGEETIGSVLQRAGYATGGFGKWGCGGRGSTGVPEQHGFDTFVGYYDQVHAHTYYPPYILRNSEELPLEGNRGGETGAVYAHYVIVDEALGFIREHQARPFFCYMPVTPPHGMFSIPDDDPAWALYAKEDWPEPARRYAAMVTMLDRQVGDVLALLEELGIADNTLVMFGGDNGGNDYFKDESHPRGFHGPNVDPRSGVEFRGTKGTVFEGGLRVPMIAYWPGRIGEGIVSDHLWYFPDLLPTFAALAGAAAPDDIDGLSIVPELLQGPGAVEQEQHDYLYWELGSQTAVRRADWKAVRTRKDGDWSLFDLRTDVSETTDVAAAHPDVLAELVAFAAAAHEPVREGEWGDRTLHDRDRRSRNGRQVAGRVHELPVDGLLARDGWRVVRVSSESAANGKVAQHAIDGDPRTHWHTRFGADLARPPHEFVLDLGATREVRGLAYLVRQDAGWNGAIAGCEFYVGASAEGLGRGEPAARGTFGRQKSAQRIECEPTQGRFVLIRILSELGGGPWASAAEFGIVGK